MNNLQAFWDAVKASSVESYGTLARLKSAFQVWLSQNIGHYGDYNTENLRTWALQFSLSRRDFADLINAYLATNYPSERFYNAEICGRCGHLEWQSHFYDVRNGTGEGVAARVCSKCVRSYYRACDQCGQYHELRVGDLGTMNFIEVRSFGTVCSGCIHRVEIHRCESCARYYHQAHNHIRRYALVDGVYEDDDAGEHWVCTACHPPEMSRCKPRVAQFQFPALNLDRENKLVTQDEIFEIATGGGDVSATGLVEIKNLIASRTMGHSDFGLNINELVQPQFNFDNRWMTKEGNMPKRLAKLLLNTYHLKLAEDLMSEIGNIAQRYTSKPGSYRLSITRNVNRPRHEFVNGDSCWWTSYWWSRCNFKSLGGFGLRTWATGDDGKERPTGRAWMIPMGIATTAAELREIRYDRGGILKPTPDVLPAEAYIVFNGYGPNNSRLDSMEFGRMVAAMTGKSYRKIQLSVSHHHMYVNGTVVGQDGTGSAVLVATQEVCDQTSTYALRAIPNRCACVGKPA